MELDLENPLPTTTIHSLFIIESDQHPSQIPELNPHLRREIISLISLFSCNFDYSVTYLAINYLDRFLFSQSFPMGNPWAERLTAISFVCLALKMTRKTEFSVSDIQLEGGFIFDTQTICRMEKIILGALKWRMRSITPFSFINFFISSFKFKDSPLVKALKARATEIIFKAQNDVKMLDFKPSLISAAALLCASHELFPLQFSSFKEAISTCEYVNKDKMYKCFKKMQEMVMDGYESVLEGSISSSNTPVNVLDLHSLSTISSDNKQENYSEQEEEATKAAAADNNNNNNNSSGLLLLLKPETKRRKINPSQDRLW